LHLSDAPSHVGDEMGGGEDDEVAERIGCLGDGREGVE
jgi:hypothetical protein